MNWGEFGGLWGVRRVNAGKAESKGCGEVVGDDIVDKLPKDPFGMEIRSTTFAAIGFDDQDSDSGTEWSSDFIGFGMQDACGIDWIYSGRMNVYGYDIFKGLGMENESNCVDSVLGDNKVEGLLEAGPPLEAMVVVLGYLGARDLLAVERVCRSLRDWIRTDPSLWRTIQVEQPFNEMITDETLVKLTSRAHGTLECLSLVDCRKITDNGLMSVLQSNPKLAKLSVPGCIKLSLEGILVNLRALKSAGSLGIKQLRIGGRIDITREQFEELKFLIGVNNKKRQTAPRKPQFYSDDRPYLPWDDDLAIDLDMCPKCENLRLVYDCPAESCVKAGHLCRACKLCTRRCIQCGCCIDNRDYEEMFCLGNRCLDCKRLETFEMVSYRLCLFG